MPDNQSTGQNGLAPGCLHFRCLLTGLLTDCLDWYERVNLLASFPCRAVISQNKLGTLKASGTAWVRC